jgi:collagenase-like PrtC family protease
MNTNFTIATNFDNDLLGYIANLGIAEIYGGLTTKVIGTSRPNACLPYVNYESAESHIRLAKKYNLSFNLLLNSACWGNIEFTPKGQNAIREIIDFACQVGVEKITTANPVICKWIKMQYPNFIIKISVHAEADSVSRIEWWLKNGADIITLPTRCNRNFRFLKQIVSIFSDHIEILVNNLCLPNCPLDRYHGQIVAHDHLVNMRFADICLVQCNLYKFKYPHLFFSGPWIRSEDIKIYEQLGFRYFKLADRCKATSWLMRVAKAYSTRQSPEDIMSILNHPAPYGEEERIKEVTGWKMPEIRIINELLNGFLEPFVEEICFGDCSSEGCSHCKEYADKALLYDHEEIKKAIQILEGIYLDFIASYQS